MQTNYLEFNQQKMLWNRILKTNYQKNFKPMFDFIYRMIAVLIVMNLNWTNKRALM